MRGVLLFLFRAPMLFLYLSKGTVTQIFVLCVFFY